MKEELKQYGLSEKEIEVYLAALQLGECTAHDLSSLSQVKRSTIYDVLHALKEKGLMTTRKKDAALHFQASEPAMLFTLLEQKKEAIASIVPTLEQLRAASFHSPVAEVFEGTLAVKQASLSMLEASALYAMGGSHVADDLLGSFTSNFARKRVAKKLPLYALIEHPAPQHMVDKAVAKFTTIRTLPAFKGHKSVYFLYDATVLIFLLHDRPVALRVQDPLLFQSQKLLFDLLWKSGRSTTP